MRKNTIAILASSRLCQVLFLMWADLVYAFNERNFFAPEVAEYGKNSVSLHPQTWRKPAGNNYIVG